MVSFWVIELRIWVSGLGSTIVSAKAVGQGAEAVAKETTETSGLSCRN